MDTSKNKRLKIVTHNGRFHADEVFACMIVRYLFPMGFIVRTRDKEVIRTADVVIDVGREYDSSCGRFDHHQFKPADQLYGKASAGLVWDYFSEFFLNRLIGRNVTEHLDLLEERVSRFITEIDYADIGLAETNKSISITNLIGDMNVRWDEHAHPDIRFMEAMDIMERFFISHIKTAWAEITADHVLATAEYLFNDVVCVLSERVPWQMYLESKPSVVFIVFPIDTNKWRVQAVSSFIDGRLVARGEFPNQWADKQYDKLGKITGTTGTISCNRDRYIVDCMSRESAISIAQKALQ